MQHLIKCLLFLILFALFSVLYMKPALEQYYRGSITMGERNEMVDEIDYPVFIICPQPGFKQSFYKDPANNINKSIPVGYRNVVWKYKMYRNVLLKDVTDIPTFYKKMSYVLGVDWKMTIMDDSINEE